MDDIELIERLHDAISKGERSRVLFELLMAEIGLTYANTGKEVFDKLKTVQEEYNEAIQSMAIIMQERHTNGKGVSVSQ